MTAVLAILLASLAATPDRPAAEPAPHLKVLAKLQVKPWNVEDYDRAYFYAEQQARLDRRERPESFALGKMAEGRMRDYPGELSAGQKRRLYRAEVEWVEVERKRRDDLAAWKILEETEAKAKSP